MLTCYSLFVEMLFMVPLHYVFHQTIAVTFVKGFSNVYMFACAIICVKLIYVSIAVIFMDDNQLRD